MLKKLISILLVVIWMSSIFSFSNQEGTDSSSTSRKVSEIIVNILDIKHKYETEQKEQIISNIEPYIRKLAHYAFYMLGGFLIINAVRFFLLKENMKIITSFCVGALYAVSDELHQLIIPR